jgi:hypothetical protein
MYGMSEGVSGEWQGNRVKTDFLSLRGAKRRGCAGRPARGEDERYLTMKGRASQIGPESCVSGREVWDEALTGVLVGQVLSRERLLVRDADAVRVAEGNMAGRAIASALPVPRGRRPWHASETSCMGTGRSHGWPSAKGRSAPGRPEGRSR